MEKREIQKPENICCPEGVWSREAILAYAQKIHGDNSEGLKVGILASELIEALLLNPEIEIFMISSYSGEKRRFDRDLLRSQRAVPMFLIGFLPYSGVLTNSRTREGGEYIFLNKEHFERFLRDEPIIPPKSLDHIPAVANDDTLPKYVPPYLAFMNLAVKSLKLSANARTNKDTIIEWLKNNWPNDLEGKSEKMIQYMATFLRRPEDKKGGNTPWNENNNE